MWIDDPGRYALTGAHSRFAIPSIASRVGGMAQEGWQALQQAQPQRLLQAAGQRLRALKGGEQGGRNNSSGPSAAAPAAAAPVGIPAAATAAVAAPAAHGEEPPRQS